MKKSILTLFFILASFSVTKAIAASELRGIMITSNNASVPAGTKINVKCGNFKKTEPVHSNGSFSVRGLPSNTRCSYQLKYPDGVSSKDMSFNSGSSVVQINAEIRQYSTKLLIIPR